MKIRICLIFSLLCLFNFGFAQTGKVTISGTIKDATTGEDLIGAVVRVKELQNTGAVANVYGFYSLSIPAGKYTVIYSYLGFAEASFSLDLKASIVKNLELNPLAKQIEGVEIKGEKENHNVVSNEMSVSKVSMKDIERIPVIFGEKDVMKTIQLLPGVKSEGDGGAGFFVRGGSADQNLILLDEATVYNASHMLGFFSVFNSDALRDVKLYKGGIPAQYGGRLSSVMDVKMKEGNSKEYHVNGGIGIIASKISLEGPIVKDKGSFIVSARRTYADMFLKLSKEETRRNTKLYFYDFNLKANYQITPKDRLYLSGYFGRDKFGYAKQFGFDWGNKTVTMRWNHIFNDKLFSNTSLIYNDYNYVFKMKTGDLFIEANSNILDYNLKEDLQYFANDKNKISFGGVVIRHAFSPGEAFVDGVKQNSNSLEKSYSYESSAYVSNDQKINELLQISYGLRYSNFTTIGPQDIYTYDSDGNVIGSKKYSSGQIISSYNGLAPRISAVYEVTPKSSIKSSYSRTYQYLHLLSNSTTSSPTDVWIQSSNNVKPEICDQVALGYFRNFKKNTFEFSSEIYYKNMQNSIDYRTGSDVSFNPQVESGLLYGKGRAYGLELFFKKRTGKFTGWVSYTLSKVEKNFDQINQGSWYPARQDRTHDISIVGMYEINERLNFAATWVYYTGSATTFPSGKYEVDGRVANYYTERNGYRMPPYHRLDLGVNWESKNYKYVINPETGNKEKVKRKFESSWNFSLYNAYGRENAYSITFKVSQDDPNKMVAEQLSLFRWVPSITYNFKF